MTRGLNLKIWLAALIIILSAAGLARAAVPDGWFVLQLTDNTYYDVNPRVCGSYVVWEGQVNNSSPEIFLYDGIKTSRLTDSASGDFYPEVSDSGVVWWLDEGGIGQVLLYDWMDIIQLSDGNYDNSPARIDGSSVVWDGSDGSDYEIYLYDIDVGQTMQLTDDTYSEWNPNIVSGSKVAWFGWDGIDNEIYLYDIGTGQTLRITNNSYDDRDAYVSGSYVVWLGKSSGNYDVYLYDIATNETTRLTNTMFDEWDCRIAGSNVVWCGLSDSWYFDIYLYKVESGELVNITNSNYDDYAPEISDSGVVWYGYDGKDNEIYMYDIESGQTFQLTDNTYQDYDPHISGLNVAWYGYDGSDMEVFFAGPPGEIDLSFLAYDFGDVGLGSSSMTELTVSNVGKGFLVVNDIAFQEGDSNDFSAAYEMDMPMVLQSGQSCDITITFTPSVAGTLSAVLEIQSDDFAKALMAVELNGTGMENSPAEQIKKILAFFDDAVEQGTLRGVGRGRSADMRLRVMRYLLGRIERLIQKDMYRAGCALLRNVYMRADGAPRPKDFVVGQAREELAGLISGLMVSMDCKCSPHWPCCHGKYGMKNCNMGRHFVPHKCHK
jgi:beta propeller repeat protein